MELPRLSDDQEEELRLTRDIVRRERAATHRSARRALAQALTTETASVLETWLDALFSLDDEREAWALGAEQGELPELPGPLALEGFSALRAMSLPPDAARALITTSHALGQARLLALAVLAGSAALHPAIHAELARTKDDQATWALLDWLADDAPLALLTPLSDARRRAETERDEARRARSDDVARWLEARGFPRGEVSVRIRMKDVPKTHRKASHLRNQVSALTITVTTAYVRGPELDLAWSITLLGASSAEELHGFVPSRWSGGIEQGQAHSGEASGAFTEPSASPVRKPRTETLTTTLEALPRAVDAIERLTGRSFHRDDAEVSAFLSEVTSPRLEAAVRAWLLAR